MTTLTKIARTILRSRVRRHRDAVLIGQHISGNYGAGNVSSLTNAQLLETAAKFNVPVPDADELREYAAVLAITPGDTLGALATADQLARSKNPAGPMASISDVSAPRMPAVIAAVGSDLDDDEGDETPDTSDDTGEPAPVAAPAETQQDAEAAAVDAEVKSIMATMGAGDFQGYQAKLRALVVEARKPAEIVHIAPIDASKIKGYVPQVIAHKTMHEAGFPASLAGVKIEATKLPVYDAPDTPAVDPLYIWPEFTGAVLAAFRRGKPVFGTGPAGTGKTEFAKQIAARYGRPFVRISCDDQTEAQTLVGMTVPAKEGGVIWQDGQLTAAIRRPGTVILIDEPSVARPGALFVLQSVMDADKKIHIAETGEVVHLAPDVVIFLADNTNGTGDITGQYEATRRLNRATLDRPSIFVRFDYLSPLDEAEVIHKRSGCQKKAATALAKFAALTRTRAEEGKLSHPIGLRLLIAYGENLADGVEAHAAYRMAVLDRVPFDDVEPLRQMFTADMDVKALQAVA